MNERTAGAALLIIGVVALFAAIVGGGIKIREIEVGSVPSRVRQGMLAAFGLVVGIIGLVMVLPDETSADATAQENASSADDNAAPDAAGDANTDVANAAPADQTTGAENNDVTVTTDENAGQ